MILIRLIFLYAAYTFLVYETFSIMWEDLPDISVLIFSFFVSVVLYGFFVEFKWIAYIYKKTHRNTINLAIFEYVLTPSALPILFTTALVGSSVLSYFIVIVFIICSVILFDGSGSLSRTLWVLRNSMAANYLWGNKIVHYASLPDDGVASRDFAQGRLVYAFSIIAGIPILTYLLSLIF